MNILIKTIRISGFRGLENIEVNLESTTVLTGINNSGKTSFLKALQLVLGNRQFITQDDFYIRDNIKKENIIIDILLIPVDEEYNQIEDFSEDWEILFTTDRIRLDGDKSIIPLRTIVTLDPLLNYYKSQQYIMQDWPQFEDNGLFWYNSDNGNKTRFNFDELPFFYMDAQRDILDDTKARSSYIGKMLSKIEYSQEDIKEIEEQIAALNEKAVSSSDILQNLKNTLSELDSAIGSLSEKIEITPFTKKIRDLSKGLSIYYSHDQDSFPMEYHGMGTRSWSSLLTLKSYIQLLTEKASVEKSVFFPVLAIEEPEAHLHPNAQKRLYDQISSISGQTIISTHSPYIAATSKLNQIRSFYKDSVLSCGEICVKNLDTEDIRKIKRRIINTRGEIFFSRLIVLLEGETEEQALPIFSKNFFSKSSVEMGIDFVGVGGYKGYSPFIKFAESLKIPWLIFSDAEPETKDWINKLFEKSITDKTKEDIVIFLDDGNSFEKQLISDNYQDEIRIAIASCDEYVNEQHREAKEATRKEEISHYTDDELYDEIKGEKTKYGPLIAEQIILSDKGLPMKVKELLNRISKLLNIEEGVESDS